MRLRLPRWLRRDPAPLGRHMRGMAPVAVPGAAATLVASAAEPYLAPEPSGLVPDAETPSPPPRPEAPGTELPPAEPLDVPPPVEEPRADGTAVTERDAADPAHPGHTDPAVTLGEAFDAEPAETLSPVPAAAAEPTVALGFADGEVLELAADDPRAAGFRDVAAAVLGHEPA